MRALWRSPVISVVAVMTLALGIGANTAIFSVVDGILLRPLPYPEPDRLVAVWSDQTERGGPRREWLSYPDFADLRELDSVFEDVAVYAGWAPTLTGVGEAMSLAGADVTAGMFSTVLQVEPARGRTFRPEDDRPGAPGVVVLSHGLWSRAFGSDPSIIGRTVSLDAAPYTVIGVMPPDFRPPFLPNAEIWRPMTPNLGGFVESRNSAIIRGLGRLRPGVSLATARAQADLLADQLAVAYPESADTGFFIYPLQDDIVTPVRTALHVLLGAVGLILLIACVNVANLLLARGASRRGELAVRAALGAGRWRIVRQLLTESVTLAAAGGAVGLLLAVWGTRLLVALAPAGTPRIESVTVDLRVLAFTGAISLAAGLAFGLLPALRAGRPEVMETLKEGGRGGGADSAVPGRRIQNALVISQVALALTLLVGAGLLLRSFAALGSVDLGFQTEERLTAQINLPRSRYETGEERAAFFRQLLERLEALPGVEAAAATATVPLTGFNSDVSFTIEGRPRPEPGQEPAVWYRRITPGYFDVMGIRLLSGRPFAESDHADAPPVVIINESFARRHFPGVNPVGLRINLNDPDDPIWREIVGVAANIKNFGIRVDSRNALYLPYYQSRSLRMALVLEVSRDPAALSRTVRREIANIDPLLAATGIATLDSIVSADLAPDRFVTFLLTLFAALAMILAVIGLYSVVSYSVARRLREVGIRMALGAGSAHIVRLVVGRSLLLVGAGIAMGLAGALVLTRLMEGLLFGVSASDPLTFAAVAVLLTVAAGAAASIPARRAAHLDAMSVLRME
ncbi:MAG: ABC transporter permease [Gemmatimonadetes bacterium]|uniref:ABC transporter permease n=1 Tax=Candidatus Kutchimonas denitrificans TaxID=3056748 RepID=A0AAE5CC06_9BACT|nr:ABC transporter permease [Gemmatimonadota bacterium]NIR75075.1 ABC transporter permease [Candidatus Kutchimonas denitrificans]NIS02895.1 ABC transporter permease [Gemmatimonadota bacterium]NIT68604.1 ABC transporter permease [Gemmatimonadota bacterium]NIU52864.1 FtsX-like permease family protein [Gemmatimonadota bacterium]